MQSQQTITDRSKALAISMSREQESVDTAASHTLYNSDFDYLSLSFPTLQSTSNIFFFSFFSSVVIYVKISPLLNTQKAFGETFSLS